METYIDRIKALKAQKKITNEQLAEQTGIPLGTLSKILAGMSDSPKLATVVAICRVLDCSLEYVVSGTPENTNNYTLTQGEIRMVEDYRKLDALSRELVELVIHKEAERAEDAETVEAAPVQDAGARILRPISAKLRYASTEPAHTGKRSIPLYELPVSAGVGLYLDEVDVEPETIRIPNNDKTAEADYVLRISGNSMEPKFFNGDYLLVKREESVEEGELGIFLLDGEAYFKVYGGDRLISLNPDYGPILLKDFSEIQCKGRVIGRLRRK